MAIYKLGDIGELKGGISSLKKERFDSGINFVNYMDIFKNYFISNEIKLRKYDATKKDIEKYGCKYGDVFFTASSETPNEIAFSSVYLSKEKAIFNGFSKRYRFDHSILLPKFASYLFRANKFRNKVKQYATGYTRFNISQANLSKLTIEIPSTKTQKQIIDIIEHNEKLFLSYSNCVRIDSIEHTQKDMKLLIDIIEPIDNLIQFSEKQLGIINKIENYILARIFNNKKQPRKELISESRRIVLSNEVVLVGVGYNGFTQKNGRISPKSKMVSFGDIGIGLISKDIPLGFNISKNKLGISTAYKTLESIDGNIAKSWYIYHELKLSWTNYVKSTSRQGQGFEINLFLDDSVSTVSQNEWKKIEYQIQEIIKIKNNILSIFSKLKIIRNKTINYFIK